jgi:hypothetical protein
MNNKRKNKIKISTEKKFKKRMGLASHFLSCHLSALTYDPTI